MKIDEFLSSVVDEWGEESNSWLPNPSLIFFMLVGILAMLFEGVA
jgi:hypothetical protein